jgi:hypothetical protein
MNHVRVIECSPPSTKLAYMQPSACAENHLRGARQIISGGLKEQPGYSMEDLVLLGQVLFPWSPQTSPFPTLLYIYNG